MYGYTILTYWVLGTHNTKCLVNYDLQNLMLAYSWGDMLLFIQTLMLCVIISFHVDHNTIPLGEDKEESYPLTARIMF